MMLLGLLSALAFLSVSEGAPSNVLLTVTYNTSSAGQVSSETFYVPLGDFLNILKNISDIADTLTNSTEKDCIEASLTELESVIPKLQADYKNETALEEFGKTLLNLLRCLRSSTDPKLNDIFLELLSSFMTKPTGMPMPAPTQKPISAPDLSSVATLIAQLLKLSPELNKLINSTDSFARGLAQDIFKAINSVNGVDPWTSLINALEYALTMLQISKKNPDAQKAAKDVVNMTQQILTALPANVSGLDGLPALLVTLLANAAVDGKIDPDTAFNQISSLQGVGKDDIGTIVDALNSVIAALTEGLPKKLEDLFGDLMEELTEFGRGADNTDDILDTLGQLVPAVKRYTGNDKNAVVSLLGIILNALKPLLGKDDDTNSELQKLLDQLNLPAATTPAPSRSGTTSKPGCPNSLVPTVLCLVDNLVGSLGGLLNALR